MEFYGNFRTMKTLTLTLILLTSTTAFSCPFHAFFLDDEIAPKASQFPKQSSSEDNHVTSKVQQMPSTQFGSLATFLFGKKEKPELSDIK